MATPPDPIQAAFSNAVIEFKAKLINDELFNEILKTDSIDKVYAATDALQAEQAREGRLRRLVKIQPYIERLRGYESILDTFVQVKPDVLALIWGPIKLLILWTSTLTQSFDALVETTAEIGQRLPEFKEMTTMFYQNGRLNNLLVLFFQDILDFYYVALKFFSMSRWRYFFESVWPKQKEKIRIVMSHIERHTVLMRDQVRLEHIREEHDVRRQALEHFDKTQRHNQHQEYTNIKTNVSPKFYDARLDWIRGRVCQGTGKWLRDDETFRAWLDVTNSSTKILWLQGIPGAGKTFLTSTAIDATTRLCRTVFAFLNHIHSNGTSALSVLHSLMFQLASEDEDLQEVLCQSSREKLKFDLDIAGALLQTMLHCAGPVYIIVDGVDEIEEKERVRLLSQLTDLSKACPESRILISSRPEDDINKVLAAVSSTIRVDTRNAGSIQAFVNNWTREWLQASDFLPEYRAEVVGLLAPVAANSKGMFLYAQIMLGSIELLTDIDDIRNELRVLPEDLDQAYGRIFRRINNLRSSLTKTKCRSLLGWVSCSPTPMTIQELEQAWVVSNNPESGFTVSSSLNLIRLCGPIVEVVDNYVQFVHFTVQEYIRSPRTNGYIDITEASLSLATCCIRYICQSHHDIETKEEIFEGNILSGCYRLHYFAADTWLDLVVQYLRLNTSKPPSTELTSALDSLYEKRGRWRLGAATELDEQWYPPDLQRIESHRSDLFMLLREVARFRQKCSKSQYHLDTLNKWIELDPLTISEVSMLLHKTIDRLMFQTTQQYHEMLERHYGQRLYKCGFMCCLFRRQGFSSKSLRDSHAKHHDLPWKCDVPSCQFAEIGFLSRRMRNDHREFHRQEDRPNIKPVMTNLDKDEVQPILFDLIRSDDVESVKLLLHHYRQLSKYVLLELLEFAAFSGSASMLGLLLKDRDIDQPDLFQLIYASIDAENLETLTLLLNKQKAIEASSSGLKWDNVREYATMLAHSLAKGSVDVNSLVEVRILARSRLPLESNVPFVTMSLRRQVIAATARCSEKEDILINLWLKLGIGSASQSSDKMRRYCNEALNHVARTTLSIRLAQKLLEYGAEINTRRVNQFSPLLSAAMRSSAESAEFIKFLLYQGADPDPEHVYNRKQRRVRDEKGAQEIGKWLHIAWDELIQRVQNDRAKGILYHEDQASILFTSARDTHGQQ